jgi:transcriptional regulator with XRE-family HTH domain
MLGWSQEQLAAASKVAKATIANFEASLRLPQGRTLDEIRWALETAGIEFTNDGQPGIKMITQASGTPSIMDRPQIVSSSALSVRLHSYSSDKLRIVITIERPAIDDYFHLEKSSTQYRRDIVEENLDAVTRIAGDRYEQRNYSTGTMSGSPIVSIVLRLADLQKEELSLPVPGIGANW